MRRFISIQRVSVNGIGSVLIKPLYRQLYLFARLLIAKTVSRFDV